MPQHFGPSNFSKENVNANSQNSLRLDMACWSRAPRRSGSRDRPQAQTPSPAPQAAPQAEAAGNKPNILVIWGDDIGQGNISAFTKGVMGYRTPNIDRVANEGMIFTDYYGEQSCTAGRSSFITGQSVFRTGLSKVGLPGADLGLRAEDPTIATLLKARGYATGQFGKNHLGDKNEFLPTLHGFDEFFGNLYHLNAEEEPEDEDYPKDPAFRAKFGPRGVLHTFATDTDDPTVDPRFGKVGKQTIDDTGPLTKKRMETVDDETVDRRARFHRPPDQGRQAVLRLVERNAYAFPHPCRRQGSRHFGSGRIFRRDGAA